MKEKTIGRVYMRIKGKVYKLVTITVGADGSIYMCTPLGSMYRKQGVLDPKITYHPDGNVWLTAELSPDDMTPEIKQSTLDRGNWSSDGVSVKGQKVYVRGKEYTSTTKLKEIKELLCLKPVIIFDHLLTGNLSEMFVEASEQRAQKAKVIDADGHDNLSIRFCLVHVDELRESLGQLSGQLYSFEHTTEPIYLIVRITDEKKA